MQRHDRTPTIARIFSAFWYMNIWRLSYPHSKLFIRHLIYPFILQAIRFERSEKLLRFHHLLSIVETSIVHLFALNRSVCISSARYILGPSISSWLPISLHNPAPIFHNLRPALPQDPASPHRWRVARSSSISHSAITALTTSPFRASTSLSQADLASSGHTLLSSSSRQDIMSSSSMTWAIPFKPSSTASNF